MENKDNLNFLPRRHQKGNSSRSQKSNKNQKFPPFASFCIPGGEIRYIRRKLGLSPDALARSAGIGSNTLLRLERGEVPAKEWVLGRILKGLGTKARECFLGTVDIYDHLIPPKDFGSWLRNFRLQKGLQQTELARVLGIHKVSLHRYEKGISKPDSRVLQRLIREYSLEGDQVTLTPTETEPVMLS